MDTAQRSQATSQIAGLPHLIHCSNYTISCHYSCYLDLSSWPSREGWGWAGAWCRREEEGERLQHPRILHLRLQNGAVLRQLEGKPLWQQLVPCFGWEGLSKICFLPLCLCTRGCFSLWFFSLHSAWSLLKVVVQSKEVWSGDNQHYTNHCVISRIFLPAASPANCFPARFGSAKGESKAWRLLLSPAAGEFVWVCSFLSSQRSPPRTWKLCDNPFLNPDSKAAGSVIHPGFTTCFLWNCRLKPQLKGACVAARGDAVPQPTPAHTPSPKWQLWGYI